MISPIRLTPTMDKATMVNAINATFDQLQSENRTKTIKDDTGNNRIHIGREPNGHYIIAIVGENEDVIESLNEYYNG